MPEPTDRDRPEAERRVRAAARRAVTYRPRQADYDAVLADHPDYPELAAGPPPEPTGETP